TLNTACLVGRIKARKIDQLHGNRIWRSAENICQLNNFRIISVQFTERSTTVEVEAHQELVSCPVSIQLSPKTTVKSVAQKHSAYEPFGDDYNVFRISAVPSSLHRGQNPRVCAPNTALTVRPPVYVLQQP